MASNPLLEKNKAYLVKVTGIRPKTERPSFIQNSTTYYNYWVDIEMKGSGLKYTTEFSFPGPAENNFQIGVYQWIRCIAPHERGCTIEPCEPEGAQVTRQALPIQSPVSTAPIDVPQVHHSIIGDLNVSGKATVFAMAYAKDLMVAEMALWSAERQVTTEDIDRLLAYAKQLRMGLLDLDAC